MPPSPVPEARDGALRQRLATIADSSSGALGFTVATAAEVNKQENLQLATPNPIYVFRFEDEEGVPCTSIAFTLALSGAGRPATRAEALGRGIADTGGKLFRLNPFLLVYDFAGEQLLAVSAMTLFDAFREHAEAHDVPYSASSSFSLTPHFARRTLNMYATLGQPEVWSISTKAADLDLQALLSFLRRVQKETATKDSLTDKVVGAVKARLAAKPAASGSAGVVAPAPTLATVPTVKLDARTRRMLESALAAARFVVLVGPPGTGKGTIIRELLSDVAADPVRFGLAAAGTHAPDWPDALRRTPDDTWTAFELIGGLVPADGGLAWTEGALLAALREDRWLVLDELNRAELDKIFGPVLTWLADDTVELGPRHAGEAGQVVLGYDSGQPLSRVDPATGLTQSGGDVRYLAGDDWRMLGTYNPQDASRVFRLGAALGRRFRQVPIPPVSPADFEHLLDDRQPGCAVRGEILTLYKGHSSSPKTSLGAALFLELADYVQRSVVMNPGAPVSELLAEGYVVTLGHFVSRLPAADRQELASEANIASVLGGAWAWIQDQVETMT